MTPQPTILAPPAALTITISRARRILLTKGLLTALNLQDGQRLDLVPQPRGLSWLLDTQSRTGPQLRYRRDGKAWLTLAHHLSPEHFHKPAVHDHRSGQAPKQSRTLATRTLTLTTEDPDRPGIYFLQPD